MSAAAKPQDDAAVLEWALKDAHIPSLMMALVHLTGSAAHLTDDMKPVYDFFGDGQGGFSPEKQQAIRDMAKAAMLAHMAGKPLPPPPDFATIRKMMDFIAGAEIPERYVPFLKEELGIAVEDTRDPKWDTPKLKSAAAKMNVVIIGAGLSGLLSAIRLQQAGVPFVIVEKNADVGGTWFENAYPGCRVDNPNHMYSYSFEPNHAWPYHFSTQDVLHDYFRRIADKYGLRAHIRFETTVEEARFDEKTAHWHVRVHGQGRQGRDARRQRRHQRGGPAQPAQAARHQGRRYVQGARVPYRALAPRRRSHGQARRGDRHGRDRVPGDPGDRAEGRKAPRLPALGAVARADAQLSRQGRRR